MFTIFLYSGVLRGEVALFNVRNVHKLLVEISWKLLDLRGLRCVRSVEIIIWL